MQVGGAAIAAHVQLPADAVSVQWRVVEGQSVDAVGEDCCVLGLGLVAQDAVAGACHPGHAAEHACALAPEDDLQGGSVRKGRGLWIIMCR